MINRKPNVSEMVHHIYIYRERERDFKYICTYIHVYIMQLKASWCAAHMCLQTGAYNNYSLLCNYMQVHTANLELQLIDASLAYRKEIDCQASSGPMVMNVRFALDL